MFEATPASTTRHVLAEGPVWVAERSELLWIDVEKGTVFTGRLGEGRPGRQRIEETGRIEFGEQIGAVVPGDDGSLLVAARDHLVVVETDGRRVDGPQVATPGGPSRSNDGGCDPAGRFLIGTYHFDERKGEDVLYRLEFDGTLTLMDSDLSTSNGLAWSPDGSLMYSTDTASGIIWVRDYDAVSGEFGARRVHLRIENGYPDGICMDSRGHLWVAIWGGSEVRSFSPDGVQEHTVPVPVPHVSSVAFVGDELDTLLITTSSRDLDAAELVQHPDAGRLFLADVGVAGLPTTDWRRV